MTNAAIRPMESQDVSTILQIQANSPETAQWTRSGYENIGDVAQKCWVAESGGTLVGFLVARAAAGEMEILNLAVAVDARRKGIGRALLREAFCWGMENDVSSAFLEVRVSNSVARQFYEAAGFVASGIRPKYYREPVENALVLARQLLQ